MAGVDERIAPGGAGGFLDPPGYPTHSYHVETDLRRRPDNRGSLSLDYAVEQDWVDAGVRLQARRKLDEWQRTKPPLSDPRVQRWVAAVMNYFRNMYKGSGADPWSASNLKVDKDRAIDDEHAGVHFIRRYYPDFRIEDFTADETASWGRESQGGGLLQGGEYRRNHRLRGHRLGPVLRVGGRRRQRDPVRIVYTPHGTGPRYWAMVDDEYFRGNTYEHVLQQVRARHPGIPVTLESRA